LATLVAGLFVLIDGRSKIRNSVASWMVITSVTLLVCLDQHRFQPWAYQLLLFTVIGICGDPRLTRQLMGWLIVSIYFYSALSKFDFEYLHSVGQQMLEAGTRMVGQDIDKIPYAGRLAMVALFPTFELAIAVGLAIPGSRRCAGIFGISMHMMLILILGPLGLNHRPAVLIWNVQFALQVYFLFVAKPAKLMQDGSSIDGVHLMTHRSGLQVCRNYLCVAVIVLACCLPCSERFGLWDHWPSWALYAPHSSRVSVEVTGSVVRNLPKGLTQVMKSRPSDQEESIDWVRVPLDAWSLDSLDTPIYPQARFQIGVAKALASVIGSDDDVRVTLLGIAQRLTGHRDRVVLNPTQLDDIGDKYWLNTKPRRLE
jgi:hypothetical protein